MQSALRVEEGALKFSIFDQIFFWFSSLWVVEFESALSGFASVGRLSALVDVWALRGVMEVPCSS